MVRGKTKTKRRKIEKRGSENKLPISKEKFEVFKFGVERLKELERELNSLDKRGFIKEEQSIRIKLKNVSEIPAIEKEIKSLKLKISEKYRPKPKIEEAEKKEKGKIDLGVGVLVDINFDNFINEVKTSLSKRVTTREKEVDNLLKSDLK